MRDFFTKQSDKLPEEIREYFATQGAKGGKKRAKLLTAEQRATIAKKAAAKRWGKNKGAK